MKIPSIFLAGDSERDYLALLPRAIAAAKLSAHYPESRRLEAHLGALRPEVHRGLYPGVEIDLRSGLPTYKEWTRIQSDALLATELLATLGDRTTLEARARAPNADPIYSKQLIKADYYGALRTLDLAPLGRMQVQLRRIVPDEKKAYFHVTFDKLDVSGIFVRSSIDFAQKSSAWTAPLVVLDEETAAHTEGFQSLIYRFAAFDAEATLLQLIAAGGLEVERVVRGEVGPIWTRGIARPPPALAPILERAPESAFIASFASSMAANDLTADRDHDPLRAGDAALALPGTAQDRARLRREHNYRLFRDRKFVASLDLLKPLAEFCAARGSKNIIYPCP